MTTVKTTLQQKALAALQGVAMVLLSFISTPALAGDYVSYKSYSYSAPNQQGGYKPNGPWNGGYGGYTVANPDRGYSYNNGGYGGGYRGNSGNNVRYSYNYRNGSSRSYNFLNNWSNGSNSTMYPGSSYFASSQHRADWQNKLRAQRQWDEMQWKKMQADGGKTAACGFTTSPAYCYKLQGPYPTQWKIVRY